MRGKHTKDRKKNSGGALQPGASPVKPGRWQSRSTREAAALTFKGKCMDRAGTQFIQDHLQTVPARRKSNGPNHPSGALQDPLELESAAARGREERKTYGAALKRGRPQVWPRNYIMEKRNRKFEDHRERKLSETASSSREKRAIVRGLQKGPEELEKVAKKSW